MISALILLPIAWFAASVVANAVSIPTPWGVRALERNIVAKFRRRAERVKRRAA